MNKETKDCLNYSYDKLDKLKEQRSELREELDFVNSEIEKRSAIIARLKIHGVEIHV